MVDRATGVTLVVLSLVILLMQFPVVLAELDEEPVFYVRAIVFLADVPLAALVLIAGRGLVRAIRTREIGAATGIWAVIVVVLVAAFAAHPSESGAQTVLRAIGALAIAWTVARLERPAEQLFVVVSLAVVAIGQTLLAAAQVLTGAPLGLSWIGEFADPLHVRGDALAPRGTMTYTYLLAAVSLIAASRLVERAIPVPRRLGSLVAAAVAVAPVGVTYSRAAIAGLAVGLGALAAGALMRGAPARRRGHALAFAALLIGAGVPTALALVSTDAWAGRLRQSLSADGPATPQDRRVILVQAFEVFAASPLTGVGPGNYLDAIRGRSREASELLTVHSTPVLLAAEAGAIAGVAGVVLLVVAGWRALRSGMAAVLLYASIAPFFAADHFLYTHAQGLVLLGVWLGSLDLLARRS